MPDRPIWRPPMATQAMINLISAAAGAPATTSQAVRAILR
jgi:hypothetical protein